MVVRYVYLAVGVVILAGTVLSIVGTLVVPRSIDSRISRGSENVVDRAFLMVSRRVGTFERRDRVLAWQSPIALLVRLAVWIGLLVVGFGLILMPLVTDSVLHAFSEAGSSMFTLGYAAAEQRQQHRHSTMSPPTADWSSSACRSATCPTLYAAFNRRETLVTLLIVPGRRAGVGAGDPGPHAVGHLRRRPRGRCWTSCSRRGRSGRPRSPSRTPPT